jgi:glucose-1-phosphate cytidylyltransferase
VIDFIANDNTVWEQEPLEKLAKKNQLNAYIHRDFWQPMDTLYEKNLLNSLWSSNNAPWKIWRE